MSPDALTYYCWHCYGENGGPEGACARCGKPISAPAEADYTARLLWALGHPVRERRMVAARVLGDRREPRARGALRALALDSGEPYLAAQALESLIAIDGSRRLRHLLERLADEGKGAPVRRVARQALASA